MKKLPLLCLLLLILNYSPAQKTSWQIIHGKIKSPWADSVNPDNVLPEYPRPQMQRNNWQNLNGLWQYSILPKSDDENIPALSREIFWFLLQLNLLYPVLVKRLEKTACYGIKQPLQCHFKKKRKKYFLHFGAVDWRSDVYINGKKVGTHEGGYDPFTLILPLH